MEALGYYALFVGLMFLCSIGFPIPEEAILVGAGYAASEGTVSLPGAIFVCSGGILAGDTLVYSLGRWFGLPLASRWPFRRVFTPRRIRRMRVLMARHGAKVLVPIRLIPVARAVAHFTAGALGYRYWFFILLDAIGVAILTPLTVWLAWYFGKDIKHLVREGNLLLALLAGLALGTWLAWTWFRARYRPADPREMPTMLLKRGPTPAEKPGDGPAAG